MPIRMAKSIAVLKNASDTAPDHDFSDAGLDDEIKRISHQRPKIKDKSK